MEEKVNILLVEDSPTQAAELKQILEDRGYPAVVAPSGEDALEYLKKKKPTMVLSDIVMPGMDGYEVCKQIKSNPDTRDIPVILVTQLSNSEDIIQGLECGADNFILKPINAQFLLSRIEYILVNQKFRHSAGTQMGMEIFIGGKKHYITSNRMQVVDLLLTAYQAAVDKNKMLEEANTNLREALDTIKALRGMIPICASCKRVRDDKGFWQQVEVYISSHSDAQFTHGICPTCKDELLAEMDRI